uniref:Tify domain-containing protein n=1 Tax=Nicotiana tabacum TaxID=4097 RepID=A0A1S3Y4M5_TOBAC|nr:uncharacterized protein LOC104098170 [Nicotiana tomentosiformis]XP_016447114.1 PREDICTED: uncharacterized protein LOC107772143 [Nicotiana tabacum]
MRRNCNLELRLVPPCVSAFSPKDCTTIPYFSMRDNEGTEEKQQQQLTIFYNGKVVVFDATELQCFKRHFRGETYQKCPETMVWGESLKRRTPNNSGVCPDV